MLLRYSRAMRYIPALDGVRALAIFLVLAVHAGAPWANGGFFGVDVFFVLSGYLITQILVAEHDRSGQIDLRRFYIRRLRRLWPAMLTMLAVFLLVAPWLFENHSMWVHTRDSIMAAVYMADYSRTLGIVPGTIDHLWSLSVEEHFYLVWPLLLLGLLQLPRNWTIAALAGLVAAATIWRIVNIDDIGWMAYHRFDTHASGLFLGCLIGLVKLRLPGYFALLGLAGLAWAVAFGYVSHSETTLASGFTFAELSTALIVAAQPKWLGAPPLAWLGRMSYGLYLWHFMFNRIASDAGFDWSLRLLCMAVGGTACAALSYYTVEAHFRRRSLPVEDQLDIVDIAIERRSIATAHVHQGVDVSRS